jgi:hypothetical protein
VSQHRTDAQKLADAIGRVREIGRFKEEGREPLVVSTSPGDTGLRYIIAQENEESLVLTTQELRWLVGVMFGDPDPIPRWRFWRDDLRALWWRLRRAEK